MQSQNLLAGVSKAVQHRYLQGTPHDEQLLSYNYYLLGCLLQFYEAAERKKSHKPTS